MTQKTVYSQHLRMLLRMHKVNVIVDSTQEKNNNIQAMPFIEIHTMISIHHKLNFNPLFSLCGVSLHIIYKISIVMTKKHIYYTLFILIIK